MKILVNGRFLLLLFINKLKKFIFFSIHNFLSNIFIIIFFFLVRDIFNDGIHLSQRPNLSIESVAKPTLASSRDRDTEEKEIDSNSKDSDCPPRRFISSILGGDVPYGARGHVLTQAQRKEYPLLQIKKEPKSKLIKDKEILPSEKPIKIKSSKPPSPPVEPAVRCSVIQRTPAATDSKTRSHLKDIDVRLPSDSVEHHQYTEPEQDQPIDYHIPKRRDDSSDEKEMKCRIVKRTSAIISRPIYSIWGDGGKLNGIMSAAAGHGRSNGQNGSNQGQQGTNSNSGGNNGGFSGSGGGSSGAGSSGNSSGNGGGGMNSGGGNGSGGRDNRSNYGPNSPPTGSLPPFYESLKGGNGVMNAYNTANASFLAQNGYNNMMGSNLNMDCDTTQEFTSIGNYSADAAVLNNTAKQFSMLHNAAYGIVLKDEIDLDYDTKSDLHMNSHMMQNTNGYSYDDGMMIDINNGVDTLPFNATLTFSSPADALLDSLSDAVDLSSFLQRLPNDDQPSPGNDLEITSNPSITPDSVSVTASDNNCLESFPDILLGRNSFDRSAYNMSNRFHDNPPSYQQSRDMQQLLQQQQQQQHVQHHHEQLSINYDIDSHSNMSLPSPSSGSMDAPPDAKPIIQSVSGRIDSTTAIETKLRVSRQIWKILAANMFRLFFCIFF